MKENKIVGHVPSVKAPEKVRELGRPRAIPTGFEPVLIESHRLGYGYRAIVRRKSHQPGFLHSEKDNETARNPAPSWLPIEIVTLLFDMKRRE